MKFYTFLACLAFAFNVAFGDDILVGPIDLKSSDQSIKVESVSTDAFDGYDLTVPNLITNLTSANNTVTITEIDDGRGYNLEAAPAGDTVINTDGTISITPVEGKQDLSAQPVINALSNRIDSLSQNVWTTRYDKAINVDTLLTNLDLLWHVIFDYTGYPYTENREPEVIPVQPETREIKLESREDPVYPYPPAWPDRPEVANIVAFYTFEKWGKKFVNFGSDYPLGNLIRFGNANIYTNTDIGLAGKNTKQHLVYSPRRTEHAKNGGSKSEDYDPLAEAEKFTIMAWIYRTDTPNDTPAPNAPNTAARIVSDLASTTTGGGFQLRFGKSLTTTLLQLYVNPSSSSDSAASITSDLLNPDGNSWVHVTVTYDSTKSSDNVKFYIGKTNSSVSSTATYRRGAVTANDASFSVGCPSGGDTYVGDMYGYIDDVIIFRDWVADQTAVNYWKNIDDSLRRELDYDEGIRFGQFDPQVEIYTADQIIKLVQGKGIDIPNFDRRDETKIKFGQFDPQVEIYSCDSVDNLLED